MARVEERSNRPAGNTDQNSSTIACRAGLEEVRLNCSCSQAALACYTPKRVLFSTDNMGQAACSNMLVSLIINHGNNNIVKNTSTLLCKDILITVFGRSFSYVTSTAVLLLESRCFVGRIGLDSSNKIGSVTCITFACFMNSDKGSRIIF